VTELDDAVGALLRETARDAVMPAYRHLGAADVYEKAPGEVVTVADRRAEELLTAGLSALLPGSVVVGEEAVAADPTVLDRLKGSAPVWLVDPVDGTANFAAGREPFAMMIALVRAGETEAAWIYDPVGDSLAAARAGAGTAIDGVPVRRSNGQRAPLRGAEQRAPLRGAVPHRYFPRELRERIAARASAPGIELLPSKHCAGREYVDLVRGRQEFVMFWRTLPWDHVPGALLVREAGGVVRRLDGSPYLAEEDGHGLLAAADEATWDAVREALLSQA
jgi:fructose-1,6-bisphosphatase/inositol monophosphatase family enzyme